MKDGPWHELGIWPTRGRMVRRFRAVADDGEVFVVIQFDWLVPSGTNHPDGMSRQPRRITYFETEDGIRLHQHLEEPEFFKVRGGDLVIRKIA